MICLRALLLLGILIGGLLSAESTVDTGTVRSQFAGQFVTERLMPILADHCWSCHGNGKRKGGLSLQDLEGFLAGGDDGPILVPGDPQRSSLITSVRWAHTDGEAELNMPPKAKLPDADVEVFVRWVAMGAPWPTASRTDPPRPLSITQAPPLEVAAPRPPLLGRLHPAVVHLPIACLVLAVLAETLVLLRGDRWRPVTSFLVIAGAAGAGAAVISGTLMGHEGGVAFERHELIGWITLVGSLVSAGCLLMPRRLPLRLAIVLTAALASLAGHLGGTLVHGAGWLW